MNRKTGLALAGGLVTALAWGGMFTIAKSAFQYLDPFRLTSARFLVASLIFVIILAVKEGPRSLVPRRRVGSLWAIGTVGFAGFNLLMYQGLSYATPQHISLIMATLPMVTLFVMWARTKKRPPLIVFWLAALALVGIAMVLGNGNPLVVLEGGLNIGVPLTLAGVVAWVVYTTARPSYPELSLLRFTTYTMLLGTISVVAITTAVTWQESSLTLQQVADAFWPIMYMAIPASVVAVLTWNYAVATLGATNGVLFMNLVPIVALSIEAFRGHQPSGGQAAGVALTLLALLAINAVSRKEARKGSPSAVPQLSNEQVAQSIPSGE